MSIFKSERRKTVRVKTHERIHQVNRRQVLLGTTVAGLSATLGPFLGSPAAANPKKGGVLRMAIAGLPTTGSLDPALDDGETAPFIFGTLRNNLTEILGDGRLVGELSEDWEASADASEWTFNLRKGVEFHNGKSLEAEDVLASINHHRGEDTKSSAKAYFESVETVKADGKNRVVIKLNSGNADFPFLLADYHVSIMPSKDGVPDWQSGVGTGPYVLEQYEAGVRGIGNRFENYWKEGHGNFDRVEIIAANDVSARTNALMTEQADAIDNPDFKTLDLLSRNPNIRITELPSTQHYMFAMHSDVKPFDDNHVRLAMKHAINREEIVEKVFQGHATVGNDIPITPANRYHNAGLPQREFDLDKARHHLKQAGLSGLDVSLSVAETVWAGCVDTAVLFKETAAKAGINIRVVQEPSDGYWSNVWLIKPFSAVIWNGRPTEDQMFTTAYAKGAAWNDTHFDDDKFNQLLVAARAELDEDKRRVMYYDMQEIVWEKGGSLVPAYGNVAFLTNKKIGLPEKISAVSRLDGYKAADRWWLEG